MAITASIASTSRVICFICLPLALDALWFLYEGNRRTDWRGLVQQRTAACTHELVRHAAALRVQLLQERRPCGRRSKRCEAHVGFERWLAEEAVVDRTAQQLAGGVGLLKLDARSREIEEPFAVGKSERLELLDGCNAFFMTTLECRPQR